MGGHWSKLYVLEREHTRETIRMQGGCRVPWKTALKQTRISGLAKQRRACRRKVRQKTRGRRQKSRGASRKYTWMRRKSAS